MLAFGVSLAGTFHFDDYSLFANDLWHPFPTRPLTYATFWLNQVIGGNNPLGYHLFNLGVHLTNVWLVWKVLKQLIPQWPAWVASALFAVSPIQAEAVNYIFARSTLLTTLFCLVTFLLWLQGRYWLAILPFAAAVLAKEECATFPVFLATFEISRCRNLRRWAPLTLMLGLAAAGAVRVALTAQANTGSGAGAHAGVGPLSYLTTQGTVIWRYLRMLVVPVGFSVDPEISIASPWFGVVGWAALLVAAYLAWRRFENIGPGFWFVGGLVLLLPTSSIFPAADLAADRRMYLPLFAFAACAALLLRTVPPQLVTIAILVLALASVDRSLTWHTEESLWADAVSKAPSKIRPRIQLARAVDPPRAMQLLEEAQRLAPGDANIASEQGRVLLAENQPQEALIAFGRALALEPNSATAINNRGVALFRMGQTAAARQDFERALEHDGCLFDARFNLQRMGVVPAKPGKACSWTADQERALAQR